MALAGAAMGLAGAAALPELSKRATALRGQAASRGQVAAELTDVEKPAAAATHRLFGNRRGPASAMPVGSEGLVTSLTFEMTAGGGWLEGYWLWVCDQGQSTAPQTFTLWIPYVGAHYKQTGTIIPGTTVRSSELVPGRWNFVRLPRAVPLSIATSYQLETGATGGVPLTLNMWGPHDPWAKGVTSGPLFAPSTGPGSADQCSSAAGSQPTKVVTAYSYEFPYYWLDVQITTDAPSGSSYRLWPSMPVIVAPPKTTGDADDPDTNEQSCGTEFWLSAECTLDKIWFFSPLPDPLAGTPAATMLPGACSIFNVGTQSMVAGTMRGTAGPHPAKMPAWRKPDGSAAKPGDGWVYCAYEGVKLPAGKYKTAVYCYGGGTTMAYKYYFFQEQRFYFGPVINGNVHPTGPASAPAGIQNGPLYSPNDAKAAPAQSNGSVPSIAAGATVHGNSTYQINNASNTGTFLYPDTFDSSDNGEVRWVDVEVTPRSKG